MYSYFVFLFEFHWFSFIDDTAFQLPDDLLSFFHDRVHLVPLLYAVALLTSAWLWVYLIVAYGMRAVSHLPSWVKLLSKVTDFDNHPVRSIGYVTAAVSAVIVAIVTLV